MRPLPLAGLCQPLGRYQSVTDIKWLMKSSHNVRRVHTPVCTAVCTATCTAKTRKNRNRFHHPPGSTAR